MKKFAALSRRLLLGFLLLVSTSYAQEQKPLPEDKQNPPDVDIVRVSTNLVTVPISVMDHQGRFVPNLKEDQFQLFENGVPQKIAYFENTESPFTVALVLDTSDSTRFKLKDIQNAALAFIEQLRRDDRVMVAAFDTSTTMLAEATSDRRVLESAIRRAHTGGGTGLYNAIDIIVKQRLSRIRGRKAMVIFTDGVDTGTQGPTLESTLHLSEELDALIYPIQYNTYDEAAGKALLMNAQAVTAKGERVSVAYARAERYLRLLASKSGGRFYLAESLKHLSEIFTLIAGELREQYSLGYYPQSGSKSDERRIKVKVSAPGVVVKARRGYLYKAPVEAAP
jgi:Ca-activated chloride channel family protein